MSPKEQEGGKRNFLHVPIPEGIAEPFNKAIDELAASETRSVSAVVRLAVGRWCREKNIPCPSDEALIGPPSGPRRGTRGGAKPARKPAKPRTR